MAGKRTVPSARVRATPRPQPAPARPPYTVRIAVPFAEVDNRDPETFRAIQRRLNVRGGHDWQRSAYVIDDPPDVDAVTRALAEAGYAFEVIPWVAP